MIAPYVYDEQPNPNSIWTAIYGKIEGATEEITVKWVRPTDGKVLTDTFDVTVSSGGGNDQGGESGGGGSHEF